MERRGTVRGGSGREGKGRVGSLLLPGMEGKEGRRGEGKEKGKERGKEGKVRHGAPSKQ